MKKIACIALLILMVGPCISHSKMKASSNHDRFAKSRAGVVKDTQTGFEWIVGLDESTSWYMAKSWVQNLAVAGGGWRMPTKAELKMLYQKKTGRRNMNPLFKTTGWWVWSAGDRNASTAWGFSFKYGYADWLSKTKFVNSRAFAVRSLEDQTKLLQHTNAILKKRIAVLDSELEKALKQNTEEYIELKSVYDSSQGIIQKLKKENKRLQYSQRNKLIMLGTLLLFCGLIGGFFVGRQLKKRQGS